MDNNLIENILVPFKINEKEIKNYSMISLAFLGDGLHSLFVRNYLITTANFKVKDLHSKTTTYVKASAQSYVVKQIFNLLSPDEQQIIKTAKNSKTNNIAKNASIEDYKNATAFESLLGYLALQKNYTRLNEILKLSVDTINNKI